MSETLQEYVDSGSERLHVDRAAGVIRGVKLLGLTSRNCRRYREQALLDAVGLYEGAKVNINHPKGHPLAPRDYQDRLGVVRSVEFRAAQGLFGDLHFNPKHALSEQLVWDAEHAPQNVGLSHNVVARTSRNGAETVVDAIAKVQSIDLVADPATTSGLYEHSDADVVELPVRGGAEDAGSSGSAVPQLHGATADLASVTVEQLREQRPDLVLALQGDSAAQFERARRELDAKIVEAQAAQRRERILELLQEHGLPVPTSGGKADFQLTSREFIESLMRTGDDATVRQLIAERAALVHSAWQWSQMGPPSARRPRSRDQTAIVPRDRMANAKEFAAAVRGR